MKETCPNLSRSITYKRPCSELDHYKPKLPQSSPKSPHWCNISRGDKTKAVSFTAQATHPWLQPALQQWKLEGSHTHIEGEGGGEVSQQPAGWLCNTNLNALTGVWIFPPLLKQAHKAPHYQASFLQLITNGCVMPPPPSLTLLCTSLQHEQ